jgi:hypothetical protein
MNDSCGIDSKYENLLPNELSCVLRADLSDAKQDAPSGGE